MSKYKTIWDAALGEQLRCQREPTNPHDAYSVAVLKSGVVVGHVPRRISSVCSLFLRHGGVIDCVVAGVKQYSADLPQGDLKS